MVWIREITLRKTSYSPHPILKMDPHTHHTVKTYWLRLVAFYFYHMNTHSTHTFQHFVNSFGNCQQSLVIGALECSFFTRDKKKRPKDRTDEKKNYCKCVDQISFFLFLFFFTSFWGNHLIFAQIGRVIFAYSKQSDERKKSNHDHTVWFNSTAQRENDEKVFT